MKGRLLERSSSPNTGLGGGNYVDGIYEEISFFNCRFFLNLRCDLKIRHLI